MEIYFARVLESRGLSVCVCIYKWGESAKVEIKRIRALNPRGLASSLRHACRPGYYFIGEGMVVFHNVLYNNRALTYENMFSRDVQDCIHNTAA